jgi:hypothetical protein
MNDVSLTRKANPAFLRPARAVWFASLALLLLGCDIVQGFQSAGDTLFPEEATHLSSPGVRMVRGGYREMRFATGGELFLLVRSSEDGFSGLHAMRYSDPKPCTIPDVVRYATGQEPSRQQALIAYLDVDASKGTLRFADTTCNSYDMQLEEANLPITEIPRGFVVRTGMEIRLVNPQTDTNELIVDAVDRYTRDAFAGRHVVRSQGKLKVFDNEWAPQGVFGENVGNFQRLRQSLLFEDGGDLDRLTPSEDGSRVEEFTVAKDACAYGIRSDTWATYRSPCKGDEWDLHAFNERTRRTFALEIHADPGYVRMIPARGSPGNDPSKDPFWFFYLVDVDSNTGLGTLMVRTPERRELELGRRASLSNAAFVESNEDTYGYALIDIDVEGKTGTLIWWNLDGVTSELARGVLRDAKRTIIDYDGVSGKLAALSGDRLSVVAEGVPGAGFEYQDSEGRWTAIVHDFDGTHGKLSYFDGTLDALEATPLDRRIPHVELEIIEENFAYHGGAALLDHVLPGIAYYVDYDEERRTGTLVYRNLELKFTALVNYGVSDFIVAEDEVIYSIPYGESGGVWVVQGK